MLSFSRPIVLDVILSNQPSANQLAFAVELIQSSDGLRGATVDSTDMTDLAIELLRTNYYGNQSVRDAIEKPMRNYLRMEFPRRNNNAEYDDRTPSERNAQRYLKQTSEFGRFVAGCGDLLTKLGLLR